ncbi:MAG TPA: hypothetical protein VG271_02280, partial [Beijerinckiaceae bacterium]|nr:hypothetical protein [Beijerinckiaceae bacterium]
GRITAKFDRLMIGAAEYSVTGLIAAAEYYEERQTIFFSINPKVYWAARNIFDFSVITDHYIPQGTGVVIEADWSLEPGLELAEEPEAEELELSLFGPEDAEIVDRKDGLTVRTARSNFTYALRTPNLVRSDIKIEPSAVVVDGWLEEGGLSIGLLDAERNEFVASGSMQQPGAFRYALEIDHIPEFYSVVFSNFREDAPGVSRFTLRRVRFAATEEVVG